MKFKMVPKTVADIPPLTENHFAQKPLAELWGTPLPPLTEKNQLSNILWPPFKGGLWLVLKEKEGRGKI